MSSLSSPYSTLLFQLPYFLVFSVGIVVALIFISRYPAPAIWMLLGCLLNLLLVMVSIAQIYFLRELMTMNVSFAFFVATNVLRSIGLGMIITAGFVGRSAPKENRGERW